MSRLKYVYTWSETNHYGVRFEVGTPEEADAIVKDLEDGSLEEWQRYWLSGSCDDQSLSRVASDKDGVISRSFRHYETYKKGDADVNQA